MASLKELCVSWPLNRLPPRQERDDDDGIPHAPKRNTTLSKKEELVRIKRNARDLDCFAVVFAN